MKKVLVLCIMLMVGVVFVAAGFAKEGEEAKGEALFKKNCAVCHPDGKNIVNPKKTLFKKDLEASKIKKPEDIVKVMRNPGPGMTKFDDKTVSDKEAREIAEYILKKFGK